MKKSAMFPQSDDFCANNNILLWCVCMWCLMKNPLNVEKTKTGKTNISCIINSEIFNFEAELIFNFILKSRENIKSLNVSRKMFSNDKKSDRQITLSRTIFIFQYFQGLKWLFTQILSFYALQYVFFYCTLFLYAVNLFCSEMVIHF